MSPDRCEGCPVEDGACWPRRSGARRICEQLHLYGDQVAGWGSDGGPILEEPGPPPAFASFGEDQRARMEAERAFFLGLSPGQRRRVAECPRRRLEDRVTCCGPGRVDVCRGGPLDGQAVKTIDCARCIAASQEPAP